MSRIDPFSMYVGPAQGPGDRTPSREEVLGDVSSVRAALAGAAPEARAAFERIVRQALAAGRTR